MGAKMTFGVLLIALVLFAAMLIYATEYVIEMTNNLDISERKRKIIIASVPIFAIVVVTVFVYSNYTP